MIPNLSFSDKDDRELLGWSRLRPLGLNKNVIRLIPDSVYAQMSPKLILFINRMIYKDDKDNDASSEETAEEDVAFRRKLIAEEFKKRRKVKSLVLKSDYRRYFVHECKGFLLS